jgi:hypothetical protein
MDLVKRIDAFASHGRHENVAQNMLGLAFLGLGGIIAIANQIIHQYPA